MHASKKSFRCLGWLFRMEKHFIKKCIAHCVCLWKTQLLFADALHSSISLLQWFWQWDLVRNSQGRGEHPISMKLCPLGCWLLPSPGSRGGTQLCLGLQLNFPKCLKVACEFISLEIRGMQQVSIENLTFWTCFCFQGSERQISYWLWLEYERALKQRNQFSLCAIIPFVADKHWWI